MDPSTQDSPLSISSNIIGILTFVVALAAAAYARFTYLRNSDAEYFRVKTSLSWYKTESAWLADLLAALDVGGATSASASEDGHGGDMNGGGGGGFFEKGAMRHQATEYQMYAFVMDDLLNLERRLLDIVADIEARASTGEQQGHSWALVPRSWQGGRSSVALTWLTVRTKALGLVRQREALTARVQFLQMSMVSSRLRALESEVRRRGRRAEEVVERQMEEIRGLEVLVRSRLPALEAIPNPNNSP